GSPDKKRIFPFFMTSPLTVLRFEFEKIAEQIGNSSAVLESDSAPCQGADSQWV
ncbi:unnamed protein product, partial [marine sediment metagenome]